MLGGAGLSASERKAREEEMAAKRQKKEAEKQRILAQAEADRKARLEPDVPLAPAAPAAPVATTGSARLQLRCPQWGRNIIFTCFESGHTLGDVRRALREDFVRGLGEDPNAEAKVPPEEAMILAEQVPPRRKFVTSEDMQITLAAAGLCPSGTLLVDAAPLKVDVPEPEPAEEAPHEEPAAVDPPEDVPIDSDENRSDNGSDDGSDTGSDPGKQMNSFKGFKGLPTAFGKGKGSAKGSGSFRTGWSGEGQVLGAPAPSAPSFPEGGQTTGDTSTAEEQKAAREARLAALQRRMESQAKEAAPRPKAPAPAMPSDESGRVKGQLGSGPNKAERAREREAILRQMEEDRQRYEERHVTASAVQNEMKAPSAPTASVRLQIRCATSGRVVTLGSSFGPDDSLLAVRNFAAQELELLPGEGVDGPHMSLAFPPRTAYTELSQLQSSLQALGLTPSATLLIKGISAHPLEEPEALEEPEQAPLEVPEAPPVVGPKCPRGCTMSAIVMEEEMWCDKCSNALPAGAEAFNCADCDYVQCRGCQ